MLSNNALVSVVVTSYNQKDKLKRAVDSVLQQTYRNIQVVIVDDCSMDDSQRFIIDLHEKYGERIKYYFQEKNVGIPKNKNTGFKLCNGELITYLDGDDFYYETKIEKEVATLRANPSAKIAYSNFNFTDINGNVLRPWNAGQTLPEGNVFKQVYTRSFPHSTLYRNELVYREVLDKINYYDESIPAFHDWDSRIRMSKLYKLSYSNIIGAAYTDDSDGISKRKSAESLINEMAAVFEKNRNLLSDLSDNEVAEITETFGRFIATQYMMIANAALGKGSKKEALIMMRKAKQYQAIDFSIKFYLRLILPKFVRIFLMKNHSA